MTEHDGITCREIAELTTEYLEGGLSDSDRLRFEKHLELCRGCSNYVGQMRETIRLTGMISEEQIPSGQREQLVAAFRGWKRQR
jgi:anti-sigma factor RsiW